jgi:hypothetical protein
VIRREDVALKDLPVGTGKLDLFDLGSVRLLVVVPGPGSDDGSADAGDGGEAGWSRVSYPAGAQKA